MWKPIEDAPLDQLILMRKNFANAETPLVVVGEVIEFKGKIHHLWRGAYDESVRVYKQQVNPNWNEKFDSYLEI